MGHAAAAAIALVSLLIGTSTGNPLLGLLMAAFIGGMAWFAFAWKPSAESKEAHDAEPRVASPNSDASSRAGMAAPQHRSVEDLYAIFFTSAISAELELDGKSPIVKIALDMEDTAPLNRDKVLLNLAIVNVAFCTIVINFLSTLRNRVNVALLMERFSERARTKFTECLQKNQRGLVKGRLTDFVRTGPEKESLIEIYQGAYEEQDLIQLDILFDALLHHRVKEYGEAFAKSNDQPLLGGRAFDVARLFCVNVAGENFEQTAKGGALVPMMLSALFNASIEAIMEGLQIVDGEIASVVPTGRTGA